MKTQRLCSLLTAAGVSLVSIPFSPELMPIVFGCQHKKNTC